MSLSDFVGSLSALRSALKNKWAISSIGSAKCWILTVVGTIIYGSFEYIGIYMGVGASGSDFLNRWDK